MVGIANPLKRRRVNRLAVGLEQGTTQDVKECVGGMKKKHTL